MVKGKLIKLTSRLEGSTTHWHNPYISLLTSGWCYTPCTGSSSCARTPSPPRSSPSGTPACHTAGTHSAPVSPADGTHKSTPVTYLLLQFPPHTTAPVTPSPTNVVLGTPLHLSHNNSDSCSCSCYTSVVRSLLQWWEQMQSFHKRKK